jgi:superfamily II DNA or RNA helicase
MRPLTQAQLDCQQKLDLVKNPLIIKSIRSGKTLCILDYIESRKISQVLWIVPYTTNIIGVYEEIDKWDIQGINVKAICYQSLKNYIDKEFDLIVLDEIHKITETYYDYISNIKHNRIIGMTGTYPKKFNKRHIIENLLRLQCVYTYTVKDAVKDQNVAPYNIIIIKKNLSQEKNILVKYIDKKTNQPKSFYASEQSTYNNLSNRIELSSGKRQMMLRLERMRFVNTLDSTIEYIKEYIQRNKSKRFLVFVATKDMAERCSEYCYYGGKTDKYFKLFQEGKINHLILVEKATVGVTYENLDQVLLTNINSSNASVQQKIFRAILFRPDYEAQIDILINNNTEQEKWIQYSISDI